MTETPFGHDQEFRALFAEEARSRLEALTGALLGLEGGEDTAQHIAVLLRELHTLKGASAMVGLPHVTSLSHAFEDLVDPYRDGRRPMPPELIDAALRAVDGLRDVIQAASRGENSAMLAVRLEDELLTQALRAPRDGDEQPSPPRERAGGNARLGNGSGPVPSTRTPRERRGAPSARPPAAESAAPSTAGAGSGAAALTASEPAAPATHAPAVTARDLPAASPTRAPAVAASEAPAADTPTATATAEAPRPARAEASSITLPVARLDELVRLVGESASALMRTGLVLGNALGVDPASVDQFRDLSRTLGELQELTIRTRMVPVSSIAQPLQRAVRELSRSLGKDVRWELAGGDTELDRRVLDHLADPLLHLVRNAVDHGLELPEERIAAGKPRQGVVRLHAMQLGPEVIIAISDDGRGVDIDRVRAAVARRQDGAAEMSEEEVLHSIFQAGLSTARTVTDVSGRGVGLDVVHDSLHSIRGRVDIRNRPGQGCEFLIAVPITLAVLPCLIVECAGRRYAVPQHAVVTAVTLDEEHPLSAGGPMVRVGPQAVPLSGLAATLGADGGEGTGPAVVIAGLSRSHAFRVDALGGQRDVVIKGLGDILPRLDVVAGAGIEADGSVLVVLDPGGLIARARQVRGSSSSTAAAAERRPAVTRSVARSVLVVDDALAVRELQRSILERAGYDVRTAVDGIEALALLAERPSDLVITDVEMPRLGGFELTAAIRAQPGVANAAILILTSRGDEADRRRGLEAGADGYIVKSSFDQAALLEAVERLLGTP